MLITIEQGFKIIQLEYQPNFCLFKLIKVSPGIKHEALLAFPVYQEQLCKKSQIYWMINMIISIFTKDFSPVGQGGI